MPGCVLPASLVFLGASTVASQWTVSSVHDWLPTIAACLAALTWRPAEQHASAENTSRQPLFSHLTQ